jgi:hypothetical protein
MIKKTIKIFEQNYNYKIESYFDDFKKLFDQEEFKYLCQKLENMQEQFGNRARTSATGVDWKALSHAFRAITEAEELLDTNFTDMIILEQLDYYGE